jgi:hypothetical protein
MFIARSNLSSDIVQINPSKIFGKMKKGSAANPNEIKFHSKGKLVVNLHMPWYDPSDPQIFIPTVWLGQFKLVLLDGRTIYLSPDNKLLHKSVPLPGRSITIHYDPDSELWTLRSSYIQLNLIIESTEPIEQIQTNGFTASKGALPDVLLLKRDGRFKDVSKIRGFEKPTVSASVSAGDFDNDMDIDLYLVCREPVQNCPNLLYENDGQGQFTEITDAGGAAGSKIGRGNQVSVCDFDRDGFLDLFVTNGVGNPPFSVGPHQLFRNSGNSNHWIEIDLKGTASNRDGIGAIIEAEAGGIKQIRVQDGGIHSWSQDFQRIHFGLGKHSQVDKLTIRWPNGYVQVLRDIQSNQVLTIQEESSQLQ